MNREKLYRYMMMSLVLLLLLPGRVEAQKIEATEVLVINSYDFQNATTENLLRNFAKQFEEMSGRSAHLNVEYLNSMKYNGEDYYNSFTQMLSMKYKACEIDLILAIGTNGIENIRKEIVDKGSIFYGVPTLFVGAFPTVGLTEEEGIYMTGLMYYIDTTKIINLIRDLHPGIDEIKIILSENDLERRREHQLKNKSIKRIYSDEIEIECVEGNYIEDIVEELSKSDNSNYALLIGGTYRSRETEEIISEAEVISQIKAVTGAPIYTYEEAYLKEGVVGGVIGNTEYGGAELAEMAYKILIEKEWPTIKSMQNNYVLNYKEIYKNDVSVERIPRRSIIINKPRWSLLLPRSIKWMMGSIAIGLLSGGGYLCYYVYKQGKVARKNRKLYEAAKVRAQVRVDFITGISHDLKTPINVIKSSVQLIDLIDGEVKRSYLDYRLNVIMQNANRLERLVANLIDTVKLEETDCYQIQLKNTNIVAVVEDVCLGALDYMKQRELTFVFDTEEEEIEVAIDREKIERVILNLLSNAIKFTPKGGNISVSIERASDQVKISIEDSGIGIDKDKVDKVFSKFYQVDNELTRPGEGSGIGLYIVKKLIELHEGEVTLSSTKGEGTTFVILLPVRVLEANAHEGKEGKIDARQMIELELSDL
ncbi:MAG: ABC transporter substrate binding protein [Cellulosilyticaceae bacterium]